VVVVVAHAHHFAGGDHERVPRVQRPVPVAEAEAARTVFEVGAYEEVVRVGVIAGRVSDGELV
jgi:hypothetical protein